MTAATHTPTAYEQEMLELINRARLSPAGEFDALISNAATGQAVQTNITQALNYFGVDLDSFRAQLEGLEAVAPVAWNGALAGAADAHSELMISFDSQSHQLPGEASLGARISDAGYTGWNWVSENVFAYGQDAIYSHAGFYIDWGYDDADFSGSSLRSDWQTIGDGIQDAAGHRVNILSDNVSEVGISAIQETNPSTQVGEWVVTQNFGNRHDAAPQLVGVVIADADGDDFYDQGEGLGGVTITATGTAGTFSTTSWASGGYQMELPAGTYQVTATGPGLNGTASYQIVMGTENLKLDVEAGDAQPAAAATEGDDTLVATGGEALLEGLAGSDTLTGSAGDDVIAGETMPVSALSDLGDDVFRLYGATLGREPDANGYASWIDVLAANTQSLTTVANGFVASQEFQTTYGQLDDSDFVTLLYNNVLNRAPDAGGLNQWVGRMAEGETRAEVVLGFSQSAEYRNNTDAAADAFALGLEQASWSDDVYRLYHATLGRDPDGGGLAGWTNALAGGQSLESVAGGFVGSTEFETVYGALDDEAFVTLLYNNVLNRSPDAGGLASWVGRLSDGDTRAEVVLGFSQSPEFRTNTADALKSFMQALGGGDRIDGAGGNDVMSGGLYADTFVFGVGDGSDTVVDLEAWDWVDLSELGYASNAEALGHANQDGVNVVFADQGTTVLFEDTNLDDFGDQLIV